jgi:hypothetical protein
MTQNAESVAYHIAKNRDNATHVAICKGGLDHDAFGRAGSAPSLLSIGCPVFLISRHSHPPGHPHTPSPSSVPTPRAVQMPSTPRRLIIVCPPMHRFPTPPIATCKADGWYAHLPEAARVSTCMGRKAG